MLKINTRYVLRHADQEKIVAIKDEADLAYWSAKEAQSGYSFTEVKVHEAPQECEACSA